VARHRRVTRAPSHPESTRQPVAVRGAPCAAIVSQL
jgi:hypothetical protein